MKVAETDLQPLVLVNWADLTGTLVGLVNNFMGRHVSHQPDRTGHYLWTAWHTSIYYCSNGVQAWLRLRGRRTHGTWRCSSDFGSNRPCLLSWAGLTNLRRLNKGQTPPQLLAPRSDRACCTFTSHVYRCCIHLVRSSLSLYSARGPPRPLLANAMRSPFFDRGSEPRSHADPKSMRRRSSSYDMIHGVNRRHIYTYIIYTLSISITSSAQLHVSVRS